MDIEGYRAHAEANHAIAKKLGAWVDVLLKENAELKARLAEAEAKERSHALIAEQLENAIDCMATAEAEAARLRSALEMVEYVANGGAGMEGFSNCAWCEAFSDEPHASDCARQAALSLEQPAVAESEGEK